MKSKFLAMILAGLIVVSFIGCAASDSSTNAATSESQEESTPMLDPTSQTSTDNANETFSPLKIKAYGYSVYKGQYLYCVVTIHNPNINYCVKFPSFRITAKDADGFLLGTKDQVLSVIYPQQDFCYAGQIFKVEEEPAIVEFEMLDPDDHNIVDSALMDHPEYEPLTVKNAIIRNNRVMGEISNNNDYDIESAVVTVVFMDENGEIKPGNSTFVDSVSASSSTPFELSVNKEFVTDNFEVYANIW